MTRFGQRSTSTARQGTLPKKHLPHARQRRAFVFRMSRWLLLRAAVTTLAAVVLLIGPCAAIAATATTEPAKGAYWGVHSSSWQDFQSEIGRKVAIVHEYASFGRTFPDKDEEAVSREGSLPLVAWDGGNWARIASGADDAYLNKEAHDLAVFGKPIMVSFEHEEDITRGQGTAPQYVAAARHVHALFESDGATNVIWVWNVTGYLPYHPASFYPGDAYVNWIMWDPYNWYRCQPYGSTAWLSFAQKVRPFYNWLTDNSGPGHDYLSKPWGLAEYGTVEGPTPQSKADWFKAIPKDLKSMPNLKALIYFNSEAVTGGRHCRWLINTSPQSLAAYRQVGKNAALTAMPS